MGIPVWRNQRTHVQQFCLAARDLARFDSRSEASEARQTVYTFYLILEARMGVAPTYNSFADCCLTTWLSGQNLYIFS